MMDDFDIGVNVRHKGIIKIQSMRFFILIHEESYNSL